MVPIFRFRTFPLAHDDCRHAGRYAARTRGRRVGAGEPSNCVALAIHERPVLPLLLQPKGIACTQRCDGLVHSMVGGTTARETKVYVPQCESRIVARQLRWRNR